MKLLGLFIFALFVSSVCSNFLNLKENGIIWQNKIKYYHYTNSSLKNVDLLKDSKLYSNSYATVSNNYITFKDKNFVLDKIKIKDILPFEYNNPNGISIRNSNYNSEVCCRIDLVKKEYLLICTSTTNKKEDLMRTLINLKLSTSNFDINEFEFDTNFIEKQTSEIENKFDEENLIKFRNEQIQKAKQEAFEAIEKEHEKEKVSERKLETLVNSDINQLNEFKLNEEKRTKILFKLLDESEKEQYKKKMKEKFNSDTLLEIKKIKDSAKNEIEKMKSDLSKRLNEIKIKADKKKSDIENEIKSIKTKIEESNQLRKKAKFCMEMSEDIIQRNSYCDSKFIKNKVKNLNCKSEENSCHLCCEFEFNNKIYKKEKHECHLNCENK